MCYNLGNVLHPLAPSCMIQLTPHSASCPSPHSHHHCESNYCIKTQMPQWEWYIVIKHGVLIATFSGCVMWYLKALRHRTWVFRLPFWNCFRFISCIKKNCSWLNVFKNDIPFILRLPRPCWSHYDKADYVKHWLRQPCRPAENPTIRLIISWNMEILLAPIYFVPWRFLPELCHYCARLVGLNASALLVDPYNVRLDIYRGGRGQSHHYRGSDKIFL